MPTTSLTSAPSRRWADSDGDVEKPIEPGMRAPVSRRLIGVVCSFARSGSRRSGMGVQERSRRTCIHA